VEGIEGAEENFSQNSQSPGRDPNAGPPEYKAGMLTTGARRSIFSL
jgi:hypothetical protein